MSAAIQAQVLEANRRFYAAFEALDLDAMEAVWERSSRAACLHPGGAWLIGWEEVRRGWEMIVDATSYIEVEVTGVDAWVEDPLGWVTCVERVRGPDGQVAEVAATNIYFLGTDGWRLILHHASPVIRAGAFGAEPA
ncbi:MAG: nuclear transport factor 2 family protein [Actinomycetota bacterium]